MVARRSARIKRAQRSIGTSLSAWRRLQSLTIQQVADRAGASPRTISRLENGEAVGSDVLLATCRALGILDQIEKSFDPYRTEYGRLRATQDLPKRIRP